MSKPITEFSWQNEKVLVTGGNGFLGKAIINRLLQKNCGSISIFCRSDCPELAKVGIEIINGDIRDSNALSKAFFSKTVVFHVAAKAGIWGKKKDFFDINFGGTKNVLDACRKNEIAALVYTSSPSVAIPSGEDILGVNETISYPSKFLAPYPQSKAEAEKLVLASEIPSISIRPHLIWGPGDPHILPRLIEKAKKNQLRRVGDGTNLVDLTYIENAAHAHILAAQKLRNSQQFNNKAYFISDGSPVNLWNWINNFLTALRIEPPKRSISYPKAFFAGWLLEIVYHYLRLNGEPPMTRFAAAQLAHSHYFDISAARIELDYHPVVSEQEAFAETVKFFTEKYIEKSN